MESSYRDGFYAGYLAGIGDGYDHARHQVDGLVARLEMRPRVEERTVDQALAAALLTERERKRARASQNTCARMGVDFSPTGDL